MNTGKWWETTYTCQNACETELQLLWFWPSIQTLPGIREEVCKVWQDEPFQRSVQKQEWQNSPQRRTGTKPKPGRKSFKIDMVNINSFSSSSKCFVIISHLKTSSYLAYNMLSKLLEMCALVRFNNHCKKNNLMQSYQSSYREHHSCETTLVRLTNDLLWNMEVQQATALVAIDLSVAFDMVDHTVLLKVLQQHFGINSKVLNWMDTYLNPGALRST